MKYNVVSYADGVIHENLDKAEAYDKMAELNAKSTTVYLKPV